MNGKKAKRLRRKAAAVCAAQNISPGKDFNRYEHIKNCHALEVMIDEDGKPMRDTDGKNLLKHVLHPGTVVAASEWKRIYKWLKDHDDETR